MSYSAAVGGPVARPAPRNGFFISPPTTDMALVFPFNKCKSRFDRSFYSPALTDGRISSEQLEMVFKDLERGIKKKLRWITHAAILFITFVVVGFLGLVLFFDDDAGDYQYDYDASDSDYNTEYDPYGDVDCLLFYMVWYFFSIIVGGIALQVYVQRRQRKARRSVESVLNRYTPLFAVHGLRWNIPLAFPYWIELWKDYKGQTMYSPQPIVQAYPMHTGSNQPTSTQTQHSFPTFPNSPMYQTLPFLNYQSNIGMNYHPHLIHQQRQKDQEANHYVPPPANTINNNN